MPKKKNKSIRKAKKKLTRPIKRARRKTPVRKKKNTPRQGRTVGMVTVELTEVEVIRRAEEVSGAGETGTTTGDALDEDFPPEYGGSE